VEDQVFKKDAGKVDPSLNTHAPYLVHRYSAPLLSFPDTKFDSKVLEWCAEARNVLLKDHDFGVGLYLAMDYGAEKYSKYSWPEVPNAKVRYLKAAFRHFFPEMYYPDDRDNEWLDSESGLHHFNHAAANIAILFNLIGGKEL